MVIQCAHVAYGPGCGARAALRARYEFLEQLRASRRRNHVALLAFGFDGDGVRLVMEGGSSPRLASVWRAMLGELGWGRRQQAWERLQPRDVRPELIQDMVVWAQRAPCDADVGIPGPLASAWSSHRDLLGYRQAAFFDRAAVAGRVNLAEVHAQCGGGPPPSALDLSGGCCNRPEAVCKLHGGPREPLLLLSKVAASVIGREPADPRSFGLFAQLARARGWTVREVADSLLVSTRRVRQLCNEQARELGLAYTALFHPDTVGRLP